MFRKALAATVVIACGLCSYRAMSAQDYYEEPATASPMAERLQKFGRSITGTGGSKKKAPSASGGTARPASQPRRQPQAQQQPPRDPYAEDYEESEFFPNTGIGEFFNNLTGRGPKDAQQMPPGMSQRPTAQPRAGAASQTGSHSVRTSRTSPAGRGLASRTQSYQTARPETQQQSYEAEATAPAEANYQPLQQRLNNSRRSARPMPPTAQTPSPERVARRPAGPAPDRTAYAPATQPVAQPTPPPAAPASERPTNSGEEVLFTRQSAMLNVGTAGPKSVVIGKAASYRVVVQNAGSESASDVIVSVRLPNWTEVVGNQSTNGSASVSTTSPGLIEWRLDEVAARGQETLTLELIPRKSQAFDLAVGWTQQPQSAQATVQVQEPKLKMDIEGPSEVHYGENQVYKLTLSNPGTGAADNVTIHLMPIGQGTEQPATHTVGTLEAGASQSLEIELTPRQAGELVIKAEATADGDLRCEAVEEVLVRRAGLAATVGGPRMQYAGTAATYEVHVNNPGNATAQDVVVTAELPTGAEFNEASGGGHYNAETGAVEWSLASLQAGAEETLTIKCVLGTPGVNNLNLKAIAVGDLACDAQTITKVEALADLVLEVSDPRGPVAVGQEVTYEVRITNRGTKNADGVDAVVFFSEGVEASSVDGGDHQVSPGQVEFSSIPTIAAGGEVVFRITARAETAGNHVFRAEVHCKSIGTSLASEETTKFYADGEGLENEGVSPVPVDEELSPTPAAE